MELYNNTSEELSRITMQRYSTSFSSSTFLFPKVIRKHVYNIYGLVRIADEVVDTYAGPDASIILDDLEKETFAAIKRTYSTNPIVHAFALTAHEFSLDQDVIRAFFASMRMDLSPHTYTDDLYKEYIYGSAEAIGLLCLPLFCRGDQKMYDKLRTGARHLGSAYQKVNFLRDLKADYEILGRLYFPGITYDQFDEKAKQAIIADIESDFSKALPALKQLPRDVQPAVWLSFYYYSALLKKLKSTPADDIKKKRVRIPAVYKSILLIKVIPGRIFSL